VGLAPITLSLEGNVDLIHVSHVFSPKHLMEGQDAAEIDVGWLESFAGLLFFQHGIIFLLILHEGKVKIIILVLVVNL
jgi:hypothetical protein